MKSYSSRELLRMLFNDGWYIKNQEGSHVHLIHPTKPAKVTIPHPRNDLPAKTVRNILRQAGLKEVGE
ncbi:MAG: type II toxin-antitoxin system HicA family toxin [Firmicutes bacterium]|nr:type II toxin-antitoxin system HicA family toxin [Bacillota bacterium]